MDGVDFIQGIEDGTIDREQAILQCIMLYRSSWSAMALIREALDALGEGGTVAELCDGLDKFQHAMDELYSIDEDGNVIVHNPE